MEIETHILDHWEDVRSHLPPGFDVEATARERGALTRMREIKSGDALLRLSLGYGACGMSLRETCAWAAAAGIAKLSDPSLLERLEKAAPWLGDIVGALLGEQATAPAGRWPGYRLRAIDATTICEPGATRTTWRLHVGYDLARQRVDHIELTDVHGGESLTRYAYRPGDIVLGDRGYARPRDLRPVLAAGADVIVRTGWNSLRLLTPEGQLLDLFAVLAAQSASEVEVPVCVDEGTADDPLPLRLVILRKTPEQAEATRARLLKNARKRGKQLDPRSLTAADYILVLTSLPAETFAAHDVLELYRLRWQIELAFKRMKSLAGLDMLPAKKPDLAQAWIYSKLIGYLLAERIAGQVPDSPPSAPRQRTRRHTALRQSITLAPDQDGTDQHPRRHSRTVSVADALPRP
jgi:hypothetical protein